MPPEAILWDRFAALYGWHPDETDRLSLDALTWLPIIAEARRRVTEMKRPKGPGRG